LRLMKGIRWIRCRGQSESRYDLLFCILSKQLLTSIKKDRPNTQWANYRRDRHLDELLRLEGRSDHRYQTKCANCPAAATEAIY
jgi:hypothetical protein